MAQRVRTIYDNGRVLGLYEIDIVENAPTLTAAMLNYNQVTYSRSRSILCSSNRVIYLIPSQS